MTVVTAATAVTAVTAATAATATVAALDFFVDGRAIAGTGDGAIPVHSPVTGEHLADLPRAGAAELDAAVAAARRAQATWAATGTAERAKVCHRIGDALAARVPQLARIQTLEQGKPLAESVADIEEAAQLFHLHAEDLLRLHGETMPSSDPHKRMFTFYRPVGTWAIITPWNFPVLMMAEFVAPGLATGNAHVVKPPPNTCMAVLAAVAAFAEAGLPPGLVNIVPGDGAVGDALVRHPGVDAIGFIGSSATGEQIQAAAGLKRRIMECSGNGPLIVCADADIEAAARAAAEGAYLCSGQVCCATERVIVDASVHDAFVEASVRAAADVRLGDPFDAAVNLGPLNNEGVAAKMDRHVADAVDRGATVLTGGARRAGTPTDLYYEYTLVDGVTEDMVMAREESFGPVVPVLTAGSEDEMLAIANRDALGLQAAVFTSNLTSAFRFMEELAVGQVIVNDSTCYWDVNMPFGGAGGRNTGWGRIGGKHTLIDMSDLRTGVIDLSRRRP